MAYLQLLVYDVDSNLVESRQVPLPPQASEGYEWLGATYKASQDGYVRAELINDSGVNTWFDDMRISLTGIVVVEENHMYPYGKQIEELSFVEGTLKPYRHGFQGQFAERMQKQAGTVLTCGCTTAI